MLFTLPHGTVPHFSVIREGILHPCHGYVQHVMPLIIHKSLQRLSGSVSTLKGIYDRNNFLNLFIEKKMLEIVL